MTRTTNSPHERTAETDDRLMREARRYVHQLRVFYTHASVAAAAILLMVVVNLATNAAAGITGEWWAWWSAWAVLGWSIGLAIHGLVVWLNRPAQTTSTWERRQIDKVLAR